MTAAGFDPGPGPRAGEPCGGPLRYSCLKIFSGAPGGVWGSCLVNKIASETAKNRRNLRRYLAKLEISTGARTDRRRNSISSRRRGVSIDNDRHRNTKWIDSRRCTPARTTKGGRRGGGLRSHAIHSARDTQTTPEIRMVSCNCVLGALSSFHQKRSGRTAPGRTDTNLCP